jgi:hypothetical protein
MSETRVYLQTESRARVQRMPEHVAPFRFSFRIDPIGLVNTRTGLVTITGVLDSPAAARFSIDVTLSQGSGRSLIHAYGATTRTHHCGGRTTWRIPLRAWDGFFTAGAASVSGYAEGCGPGVRDCWSELIEPIQIELIDLQ